MLIYAIFSLIAISALTLLITLGVYSWFNRDDERIKEIMKLLVEIGSDTSKLIKDIKLLSSVASEVAKPLLNPVAVDVDSEEVHANLKKDDLYEEPQRFISDDADMINDEKDEGKELIDETEVFLGLIKADDDIERLEEAMSEWRSKGNEYLALQCAAAIEELKVKQNNNQEPINFCSEEELQMEEDIAS